MGARQPGSRYTEADVELVASAIGREFPRPDRGLAARFEADARAVLDALAGRLLPERVSHDEFFAVELAAPDGTTSHKRVRDLEHAQILARRRNAWGWGAEIQHRHEWRTEWAPVPTDEESTNPL